MEGVKVVDERSRLLMVVAALKFLSGSQMLLGVKTYICVHFFPYCFFHLFFLVVWVQCPAKFLTFCVFSLPLHREMFRIQISLYSPRCTFEWANEY